MAFIPLKGENGVEMEISNSKVRLNFTIGQNVCLVNADFNPVRKPENAIAVEWMVRGEEALRDFLGRLSLRYGKLGETLKEKLKGELDNIGKIAKSISRSKEGGVILRDKLFKDRGILVTVKRVKGQWRASYPTVNAVFLLTDCKRVGKKYQVSLELQDGIEIGYKILYWITCSDISEKKGLKTAEVILGKID